MISSFHGMIPSFHAVFCLRQRDKSAKVIDYKDDVTRPQVLLLVLMQFGGKHGDVIPGDYLLVSFGDEDCCRMYSRISAVSSG